MNEIELIAKIREWAEDRADRGARRGSRIIVGIGDDCAVYRPKSGPDLLFKIDPMIEDVHFRRDQKPELIGQRALGRNLSDIAAMGGAPRFCLVSLTVPLEVRTQSVEKWIEKFYRGLLGLARQTGTVLAGGHLAHAEKIHCDVVVCGEVPRGEALLRSGARPGDALYVSGRLGKSWDRQIRPRLEFGQRLLRRATACIDLSDGLALDLHRLCAASKVSAALDQVPVRHGATIERALYGGEDYELLFTMPARLKAPRGATRIGTIVSGEAGCVALRGQPLEPRGYDHFAPR